MSKVNYFETVQKSFVDVPVTADGVDTVQFLQASEEVVKMFDLLGGTAFSIVQSDLTGNIAKVRTRYQATPEQSKTLELLVTNEQGEKKRTATEGLLWLLRGLHFTGLALKSSHENPSEELGLSFNKAYDATLRKHHSFVVVLKAVPYRADFYAKLGSPPEKVQQELGKWVGSLDSIVTRMNAFYDKGGYAKGL